MHYIYKRFRNTDTHAQNNSFLAKNNVQFSIGLADWLLFWANQVALITLSIKLSLVEFWKEAWVKTFIITIGF